MTLHTTVRTLVSIDLHTQTPYANPFADIDVDATFTAPDGTTVSVPAFYDGDDTWRVRFNPDRPGTWTWRTPLRSVDAATGDRPTDPWPAFSDRFGRA